MMSLPVQKASPGTPGFSSSREAAARRAHSVKHRAENDGVGVRRPVNATTSATAIPNTALAAVRRQSLRRVKDSREELRRTRARGTSNATLESSTTNNTVPSGRSFTVANINNGIIYLRPVVRTGNHRSRPVPDPFVFPPQTPPDSATLESNPLPSPSNDWEQSLYGSRTPPRTEAHDPLPSHHLGLDEELQQPARLYSKPPTPSPPRALTHVRSRSFSTADDHTVASYSTEPGTFRVVIERPSGKRPKTADTGSFPLLEVPIPNYRLGTPRFSARGTAILRSSVYTRASGTEEFRSSFLTPQRATHSFLSSRPRSDVYSPIPPQYRTTMDRIPLQPSSAPSSARVSKLPIGPQLYDALTANPDDQAVVKYSPSGDILAATPSRLVAHITSPSFLDYELLSDFFLTFRSFLSSRDLVAYLISRLRWAVDRQDDFGRIVRVRTFVALRHWILNYFVDDFAPLYPLRVYFCELVNSLYSDLRARADGGGGDIKIVGELKKCWRRTCALYWDSEDGIINDLADEELLPGGQIGSQGSVEETTSNPPIPSTPPRQTDRSTKVETIISNPSDQFASKHMDWAQRSRHTPQNSLSSPYIPSQDYGDGIQVPLSPASEQSMHILSCSIPMRGLTKVEPNNETPLYPHPVPHPVPAKFASSPQYANSVKKPNRPHHSHKRSGSFSDALRDNRAPLSIPKISAPDSIMSAVSTIPGGLVRGGVFQPGSPYIDVKNGGLRHTRSQLDLEPVEIPNGDMQYRIAHSTNPGMKKLFGSVRRALSSKQPSASTPHLPGSHFHNPPSVRSSNPTVSTTSGGVHKRRHARPRLQIRIDVLAARVAESFNDAVKEALKNEQQSPAALPDLSGFEFEFERDMPVPQKEAGSHPSETRIYSNITTGSKSIVIMDDTGAPPIPVMSGALPIPIDVDPTPENTLPPAHERDLSIGQRLADDNHSITGQSESHKELEHSHSMDWKRTSRSSVQRSIPRQRRSLSEGPERMHSFRRRGSKKASMGRASLRRHASHSSGLVRRYSVAASFQTMSSDNDPFFLDRHPHQNGPAGPTRQLRRRPGGDLRAVDNVHDLEYNQRPHSTGSISNQTHSIANSVILRSDRYVDPTNEHGEEVKVNQEDELPKKPISLVDTHSSQPNLRPSFEAEVAKLAALPDDTDDDGGIESALMKLEGRYERKSPTSPEALAFPEVFEPTGPSTVVSSIPSYVPSEHDSSRTKTQSNITDALSRPLALPEAEGHGMYRLSSENFTRRTPNAQSAVESEDSFSSIPLLDRGLSDITSSPQIRTLQSMRESAKPAPLKTNALPIQSQDQTTPTMTSPNSSIEFILETDSMKRIPPNGTFPRSSIPRESFLLDDDEELSDMGDDDSGIGTRSDETSHGVRSFFDDEPANIEDNKEVLPTHPMRHPPTPPLTANRLNEALPQVNTTVFDRGLPTPGLTPTSRLHNQPFGHNSQPSQGLEPAIELQDLKKSTSPPPPSHLPFVLAYDSEVLAQQFTLVEKDALDEIDWKELIELRWKQSSSQIRDWVQYLRTEEARGVDVVIARFNLVVKWTVSECLLTENTEERARCFMKFIHIAAHARRLRNYATMYQITIALLSADLSRLKKTWALVPAAELQTMKDLEALVQPLRNFHNLRLEMETATVEDGCIPFIGIYTRDLIYNAQKPAFIDAPPVDGERLVNFERHHTAATIVKGLLRLLEASSKYNFKVEPNIVSKCLWLAALGDEELTALSRQYE